MLANELRLADRNEIDRRDINPGLRNHLHQALIREPQQSLSHRGPAHTETLADVRLGDAAARRHRRADDHLPHRVINGVRQAGC